jgi:hypothetical protein
MMDLAWWYIKTYLLHIYTTLITSNVLTQLSFTGSSYDR